MSKLDFKLYFYKDNKLFKKVAVEKGYHFSIIVGNGKEANISLDSDRISRNHLQLVYNVEGSLHVADLNSTNGTFLNGIRLDSGEDRLLKSKDKIQLAGVNGILIVVEKAKDNFTTIFNICEFLVYKLVVGNIIDNSQNSDIVIVLFNTAL